MVCTERGLPGVNQRAFSEGGKRVNYLVARLVRGFLCGCQQESHGEAYYRTTPYCLSWVMAGERTEEPCLYRHPRHSPRCRLVALAASLLPVAGTNCHQPSLFGLTVISLPQRRRRENHSPGATPLSPFYLQIHSLHPVTDPNEGNRLRESAAAGLEVPSQ
jgi:hypothetical protein